LELIKGQVPEKR